MQTPSQNDGSSSQLEQYEDGDEATNPHPAGEQELPRYEDDEVATAPWPPHRP
jgi:hypothetical protein